MKGEKGGGIQLDVSCLPAVLCGLAHEIHYVVPAFMNRYHDSSISYSEKKNINKKH